MSQPDYSDTLDRIDLGIAVRRRVERMIEDAYEAGRTDGVVEGVRAVAPDPVWTGRTEIAAGLGLSEASVTRLIRDGLPNAGSVRKPRVRKSDAEAFLKNRRI